MDSWKKHMLKGYCLWPKKAGNLDFKPHSSLENLTPIQFRDRHLEPEISSFERS